MSEKKVSEVNWEDEWKDMPEFVQEDLTSKRKIIVHFRNDEDVAKFAELMEQKITPKQKSLWYPHMPPRRYAHLRYSNDES
jgi:hypothetical protein